MERVYNETTSDEVKRDGGYKIGDYGYGGRTYINQPIELIQIKVMRV